MIEVERTFLLTDGIERRLLEGATCIGTVTLNDRYFDTASYTHSLKDEWLRERNGKWELKVPRPVKGARQGVDLYHEITDGAGIRAHLKLAASGSLGEVLTAAGFVPFAAVVTTRRKFAKDGCNLDLDETDFGYRVGEVERMVPDDGDPTEASEQVDAFCARHGIQPGYVRGKVVEYLRRSKPALYEILCAHGIISMQEAAQA